MLDVGIIVIWSGSIATIPGGWALCDGTLGTPDLRDRFLQGAGGALSPDDTGGASTHVHTFTGDGHVHTMGGGAVLASGTPFSNITGSTAATGTTDAASSNPPFYALAYIMRI